MTDNKQCTLTNKYGNSQDIYQTEQTTALFQGKTIIVENLTPILSQSQRDMRKRDIEDRLYDVFSKYRPAR